MFFRKECYRLQSDSSEQKYYMRRSDAKIMQNIKMNLISRSSSRQAVAITKILKIIKSSTSSVIGEILIGADIPGLLCDITNNHNPKVIMKVFFCLSELANYEQFYGQRHSTVVVETICRTVKMLENKGNNKLITTIVHKGIELLIHILCRCKREVAINLNQVLEIVSDILGISTLQGVHLATISLLKIILQAEDFVHKDMPDLIYLSLSVFYELRRNNLKRFTKYVKLALDIMLHSLRYFSTHQDMPMANKALSVVWSLTESFVIPSLKELDMNSCGSSIVLKKLKCINAMYEFLGEKKLYSLSNSLACQGYLELLPDLDQQFQNECVHKEVTLLLYYILARLASRVLKFPKESCKMIGKGLKKLPIDSNEWPDLLAVAHYENVHLTVVTHLYFVLLSDCRNSLINSSTVLPALCKYLLSQSSPPTSTLLKAISFVFAVLSLTYSQSVERLDMELAAATQKLVKWLRCTSLSEIFTRHPAMLYWLFSAQVNDKVLQLHMIMFWIRDKSPAACKELKDLVLKLDEAALRLMDLLGRCSEEYVNDVVTLLKLILERDKSEGKWDMRMYIWKNLSRTLSRLSTPGWGKRLKNICCVINLSCGAVPDNLTVAVMLRISQQLVQTFQRSCGKTWEQTLINIKNPDTQLLLAQLFKLTQTIVRKMNLANDFRGLKLFLEEDSLRRGLLACLDSDNKTVTHPALRLLTYLQQSQKKFKIQVKNRGTVMGAEFLLQLVSTKKAGTAVNVARLFSNLRIVDPKRFITLSNDMSIITIHTLYLEFLNLSLRPGAISSLSWKCESRMLHYCHNYNPEMEVQLLNFPLNNLALSVAFMKSASISDPHMAEYLFAFVRGVKTHKLVNHGNYSRALCRDPISTILTIVAEQLLTKNWPADSIYSWLICQICKIGGNIPTQTINALKLKIPRKYKKLTF